MEGKTAGFESTSFSADRLYFNYHSRETISTALRQNSIEPLEVYSADYPEVTRDSIGISIVSTFKNLAFRARLQVIGYGVVSVPRLFRL